MQVKEVQNKRLLTAWFQFYEIPEKAKLCWQKRSLVVAMTTVNSYIAPTHLIIMLAADVTFMSH